MSKKILIVDDHQDLCLVIASMIESEPEYEVITCTDPTLCLNIAQKQQPHLILMDMMMPAMDGADVSMVLKHDPQCANIPVILMSSLIKPEEEAKANAKHPDQLYLSKPFDRQKLLTFLEKALQ